MKKSLIIMPLAMAMMLSGCALFNRGNKSDNSNSGSNSQQGSGSGSQQSGSQSQSGGSKVTLSAASLLGYDGSANVGYDKAQKIATVDGVAFTYQQIGAYKDNHAGMQFRNKLSDASNGTKSNLNNTAAFSGGVKSVNFTWHASKDTHDNTGMLKLTFGSSSSFGADSETKMLDTVAGTKEYTITPANQSFTFLKIEIDDAFTYTCYWESIVINL